MNDQQLTKNNILKIKNPSQKEFLEFWQKFQPFVINGVVENWQASQNWSNDYLLEKCGDRDLEVEYHSQKNLQGHNYVTEDYYKTKTMKLRDYISLVQGKQQKDVIEYYLNEINFETKFPELTKDINYPEYFNRKPEIYFWFGFAREKSVSVSHLHYDALHNIFAQIRGRKKFLLYPPINYLSFYPPLGEKFTHINHSKVNPIETNYDLFPQFPWQEQQEVILEAGDLLYVPPFWWHYVTAIDENISLSFWYDVKYSDLLKQQKLLATYLNIAPHFLRHSIKEYYWQLSQYISQKLQVTSF
jgi:Cupin-like domain